ncbi:hypothetical protein HELRODRAFT_162988 [Helobdella robusta]|uniref:Uncharacterized protein n=1 Tax=Helobdella robusta TaxID=6412 RepID=T1ETI0_HELRO|nr:hypothetical protein HELRODRAFT_162988 [Helobdella robusta]ESN99439.1 hypothetical protein HELRODRAFT_162988 [Helobdella robusta]
MSDFYSSEEISAALKQIKHDVNLLKIDVNFDTPRGPKKKDKKDKLRETIRYLGLVREKNYQQSFLHTYSVAAGQKHASYSSDASFSKIVHPASSVINTPPSDETSKQGTQSLVDLNVEAAPAHSSLSTPNNNINKNNSNSSSKQPGSFKLSAAPLPPKKIVFGVGKLKSCVKEEILEHLETIGLTAAECVPNLLDSFTRQSSYYTTRDLLNILEAKYINNHDHPLPLLHINSRKTWLNDETAKLVRMNDYNFVFKNRSGRIGGGVGIFIRSGIEFSMINNLLLDDTQYIDPPTLTLIS